MNPEAITALNHAMGVAGAVTCLGMSAAGSGIGTGITATAAMGVWKKCYAQKKQPPFILLGLVGTPITQTLYGMIVMFVMFGKADAGLPLLFLGFFSGLGIGISAVFQGRAAAAACDAQAETGQGMTNYFAALGIVETVAIFTMVFTLIAVFQLKV